MNVAVATGGEPVEEPETREEHRCRGRRRRRGTGDGGAGRKNKRWRERLVLERCLDVIGRIPHIFKCQNDERLADVEGARRVIVTREEETMVVEAELSASKKPKGHWKEFGSHETANGQKKRDVNRVN